jgi:hypothetical protein
LDAARISGACTTPVWVLETIAAAVRCTKDVGWAEERSGGMGHRVIENVYTLYGEFTSDREVSRSGGEKAKAVSELCGNGIECDRRNFGMRPTASFRSSMAVGCIAWSMKPSMKLCGICLSETLVIIFTKFVKEEWDAFVAR